MWSIIQSNYLRHKYFILNGISILTVLLFVYTGFSKLLGHDIFLRQLKENGFLKIFATPLSIILPVTEILAAVFISIKSTALAGWYMAAALMTLFTFYIAFMLLTESKLPCTCGGVLAAMSWRQHLLFNIFFMAITWIQAYNHHKIISTNKRK